MTPSAAAEKIRTQALALGFTLCGVTPLLPPRHADYLTTWFKEKKFADMRWLAQHQDKRLDPARIMPGARSAIVVAANYHHDEAQPLTGAAVARYARGQDYHLWLKEGLTRLATALPGICGADVRSRCFVDTGPVLERDLAAQAGLGWIGKNTCLINEEIGSFLFLGVILSDVEFVASAPAADACGRCRLCVDACPTGALTPYQMEPEKCLAYQNIERRGERAQQYWRELGDHLVGCDICQEVCPWNHEIKAPVAVAWQQGFAAFDATSWQELVGMTRGAYRRKFSASAISRIRYEDFMRNVFLALARHKRRELLPAVLVWQKNHPGLKLAELSYCVEELQRCD
jgi:epoxyqueuosine reductase